MYPLKMEDKMVETAALAVVIPMLVVGQTLQQQAVLVRKVIVAVLQDMAIMADFGMEVLAAVVALVQRQAVAMEE
jgi:pilus assembly protein TadC